MRELTKTEMTAINRQAQVFFWDDKRIQSEIEKKQSKTLKQLGESEKYLNSFDAEDESGIMP